MGKIANLVLHIDMIAGGSVIVIACIAVVVFRQLFLHFFMHLLHLINSIVAVLILPSCCCFFPFLLSSTHLAYFISLLTTKWKQQSKLKWKKKSSYFFQLCDVIRRYGLLNVCAENNLWRVILNIKYFFEHSNTNYENVRFAYNH